MPRPDRFTGRKPAQAPREAVAGPWSVWCQKSSGAWIRFASYATADQAEVVRAQLAAVGCPTRVAGPAEERSA